MTCIAHIRIKSQTTNKSVFQRHFRIPPKNVRCLAKATTYQNKMFDAEMPFHYTNSFHLKNSFYVEPR